jgi:tetratricopeptide (TPR) repeat protein
MGRVDPDPDDDGEVVTGHMSHKQRAIEKFRQGFDLVRQGKSLAEAVLLLEDAIRLRPRIPRYHYVAGNAYRALERFQQAFRHYSIAIDLGDRDPLYFAARGVCLRKLRRYAGALEDLSIAIEMDPAEASHWFNRGLVYFEREDLAKAEADFTHIVDRLAKTASGSKFSYRALYNRANCRRRMGLLLLAIDDLRLATALEPANPVANDALGLALCDTGDFEAAFMAFSRALEAAPSHWMFLAHRGLAQYHTGKLAEALVDLDMSVRLITRDTPGYDAETRPTLVPVALLQGSLEGSPTIEDVRAALHDTPFVVDEVESAVPLDGALGLRDAPPPPFVVHVPEPEEASPQFHRANTLLALSNLWGAAQDAAVSIASALRFVRSEAAMLREAAEASGAPLAAGPGEVEEYGAGMPSGREKGAPPEFVGTETSVVAWMPVHEAVTAKAEHHFFPAASTPTRDSEEDEADGLTQPAVALSTKPRQGMAVIPLPSQSELEAAHVTGVDAAASLARRLHTAGLVVQAAGAWGAAERCFAAAVAVQPDHQASRYHRALMLHALGWHKMAERELSVVLKLVSEGGLGDGGIVRVPASEGGVSLDAPMQRPAARRRLFEARALVRQALGLHAEAIADFDAALDAMEEQDEAATVAQERIASQPAPELGESNPDGLGGRIFNGDLWLTPVPPSVRGECEYHRAVSLLSLQPPSIAEALEGLQRSISGGFDRSEAWDKVAAGQLLLGRLKAAVRAYSESCKRAPRSSHYVCRRAQCYREMGESSLAVEDLTHALGLLSDEEDLFATQAAVDSEDVLLPVSGPAAASRAAESQLRNGSGPLLLGQQAQGAVPHPGHLTEGLEAQRMNLAAERGRLLFLRGLCKYDLDDFNGSLEDLNAALREPLERSQRGAALYAAGIANANTDDYDEAEKFFARAIREDPGAPGEERLQRVHERAKALQMLGKHPDAVREFTRVIELNPHNGKTRGCKSCCCFVPPYDRAAHAYFRRGFSFKALKNYKAAAEDLETARALDPENPALAVNYRGIHAVETVILCAAGEEPTFGPVMERHAPASEGTHRVLSHTAVAGVRSIEEATPVTHQRHVEPGRHALALAERRAAGKTGPLSPLHVRHGVPLQAADLEHGRAGVIDTWGSLLPSN